MPSFTLSLSEDGTMSFSSDFTDRRLFIETWKEMLDELDRQDDEFYFQFLTALLEALDEHTRKAFNDNAINYLKDLHKLTQTIKKK